MRKQYPNFRLLLPPAYFLFHGETLLLDGRPVLPLAGISRSHTFLGNESGTYLTFESDEHGFNNPRGLHHAPSDIVLLGDSITLGADVF